MSHDHGTRQRSSIPVASSPSGPSGTSSKVRTGAQAPNRRRLSSSASALRRPAGLELSLSVPTGFAMARRGSSSYAGEDEEGEVRPGKNKGKVSECEICSKAFKSAGCLIKHRWSHTQHWVDNSALSKHAQVAILEASTILFGASSLPVEKSLWPAAVSHESLGLLGSSLVNINSLGLSSPRMQMSRSLYSLHSIDEPSLSEENGNSIDKDEEDDSSPGAESTSDEMLGYQLEENMFDMDLEEGGISASGAGSSSDALGDDSGYAPSLLPLPSSELGLAKELIKLGISGGAAAKETGPLDMGTFRIGRPFTSVRAGEGDE